MEKNAKMLIGTSVLIIGFIAIVTYSYLQSEEYLNGPKIVISSPTNGDTMLKPLIQIDGNAKNISQISLNDASIFVDSKGDFHQRTLLLPGYNILTVKAQDKFGKKVEKSIELFYKQTQNNSENANDGPTSKIITTSTQLMQ